LPGEIAHLYEEANAKQDAINSLNSIISTKDNQLQRFVKTSGSLIKHPKEDVLNRDILDAYNKIQALQDEKIAFVQKACALLDRYVKRLDVKIRDLQAEGAMPLDNRMPSLLRHSEGNLVAISSNHSTGTNTPNPLQPMSANAGAGSFNLAQQAMNRLHQAAAASASGSGARSVTASTQHPLHQSTSASAVGTISTPASAGASNIARTREMSVGSDMKKRRLNLGTLPAPNLTNTRHQSLGPGTPKTTTPGGSRAGSVGPRPGALKKTNTNPRKPLVQTLSKKRLGKGTKKPPGPRRLIAGSRASPATTTGDELSADADSGSEDELASQDGEKRTGTRPKRHNTKGGDNDDVEMEEAADDTKYCYCQDVSHGDMIACDNADCAIQWFHWTCAGITSEPQGEWLCKECRKLPRDKIKKQ
jgi:inhibitor of growth protein 3